ncbi:MAG: leucine--tRNA ligase [Anaerolineae bacterium]|nr:leucine--tRNA ligase [Anaerolineae bacterium]
MSQKTNVDSYDPWSIEARWRQRWAEEGVYHTADPEPGDATYYCLDFFPYPSGAGLSVGHGRNYVPSDAIARYHRMRGEKVLHPMGWDAFGLPAENEAIKRNVHPADSTRRYAANYRRQLDLLGCSYDWSREISSADPAYYRWNQFFFLMLYRRGLAYRATALVNWCEHCQTMLASEEIEQGTCWRCHEPVVQRTQRQWFIRTTAYADELYDGLDHLDWPEHILTMQRHWIGRHEGLEIDLPVAGQDEMIQVFTSRVDTFFGVTFVVLAPEHPAIGHIVTSEQADAVAVFCRAASLQTTVERHTRRSDGVATGTYARLPGGQRVPIYVAGYVLSDYGTGAVMGVPAHDRRDFAFAQHHGLPIRQVIVSADGAAGKLPLTEKGTLIASGAYSGMSSDEAQETIAVWLEAEGMGRRTVLYRLRDWLISRQRYWGTPIPIVHCASCGEVPVPADDLPVLLPDVPDYRPRGDGRSPLANVHSFVETLCPRCGKPAERETDTMTGFVCSSWYYLRFTDPDNSDHPFDPERVAAWLPVDVYVGGAEHAVGHLMYARFWTKFLADEGCVSFREPLPRLRSQGVLHARDPETGKIERMSKSKGNTVPPECVIERYGADVTRLHLLFMGPFEANTVWEVEDDGHTPQHIEGVRRFLHRVWRLCEPAPDFGAMNGSRDGDLLRAVHRTTAAVTEQIEVLHLNIAISELMTCVSQLEAHRTAYGDTAGFRSARIMVLKLLAPFAPFITEELWARLGLRESAGSIHCAQWPIWDPAAIRKMQVEMAVLIDNRVRDHIIVAADASEAEVRQAALETPAADAALSAGTVCRVIVVTGRLVNIVTG